MKKIASVSVILLFIGIAVAPNINQSVVTASQDDDLVEVTTQVCGIQGYGNTTVKLTREQYQNLEQYLLDFRARLNQTSTRGEATPIFKEAVVELNKYGLLPKGMSTEKVQKLVTYVSNIPIPINPFERIVKTHTEFINDSENHFCLITGETNETWFESPMTIFLYKLYSASFSGVNGMIFPIVGFLSLFGYIVFASFSDKNPFDVLYRISFGGLYSEHELTPKRFYSSGWINTYGLDGQTTWEGEMQGTLPIQETRIPAGPAYYDHYPGAVGFIGIKMKQQGGIVFYLGSALWVKIGPERPN